jgi:hypothetical protein
MRGAGRVYARYTAVLSIHAMLKLIIPWIPNKAHWVPPEVKKVVVVYDGDAGIELEADSADWWQICAEGQPTSLHVYSDDYITVQLTDGATPHTQ